MFAYCNNNAVNFFDPNGTRTIALTFGYDTTFFFAGVSATYTFVIDDNWNFAVQTSYSAPTYLDSKTYHTGLCDAGIAVSAQVTDDNTVFDLEGSGCYAGVSAGAGPSWGIDMVYSGAEAMNENHGDNLPNGIAMTVGFGVGIDAHFKQTNTTTLFTINLKEWLLKWIS